MFVAAIVVTAGFYFEDVSQTHLPSSEGVEFATMDAVAVDLDSDGDLDLVTPQEWRENRILINQGDGRFALAAELLPPIPDGELGQPEHIQRKLLKDTEDASVGDFNGDGLVDIIMVVEDDMRFGRRNVHQYLRQNPDGDFARIYAAIPDSIANAVAHADINKDGAPDILIAGDGQDRLLINDGAGGFADETERRLPREAAVAQDAEFFDADGDGDPDIVLGLEGGHALWINNGRGVFRDDSRARLPVPGNVEARKTTPADVDNDGDLDLYFSHVSWQGRTAQDRLFINNGRGRFSDETASWLPEDRENTLDAALADFDGDGDLDLVQANSGSVRYYRNDGAGRFKDETESAFRTQIVGTTISLEAADFDGDGTIDLYVGQIGGDGEPALDRLLLNRR